MPPIYYGSAPFALKRGSQALNLYYGSTLISGGGGGLTPSKTFDFTTGSMPSGAVLTRAGVRSALVGGTFTSLSSGTPALESWGGQNRGISIDGSSQNLLKYSNTLSNAAWLLLNVSALSSVAGAGHDGGVAWETAETTTNGAHSVAQVIIGLPASKYCFSVYVRASGSVLRKAIQLRASNEYNNFGGRANFWVGASGASSSYDEETAGVFTGTRSGVQILGNGLYRLWMSGTFATTNVKQFTIHFLNVDNALANSYAGDVNAKIQISGAQVNPGCYPSSYVETTTVPVSNVAESLTLDQAGWFSASQGTLVVDHVSPSSILVGSGSTAILSSSEMGSTGIAWDNTGSDTVSNAGAATAGGVPSFTDLRILSTSSASNPGMVSRVRYWPTRLSVDDLRAVTSRVIADTATAGTWRTVTLQNRFPNSSQALSTSLSFYSRYKMTIGNFDVSKIKLDFANVAFSAAVANSVTIDSVSFERETTVAEYSPVFFGGSRSVTLSAGELHKLSDELLPTSFSGLSVFPANSVWYVRVKGSLASAGNYGASQYSAAGQAAAYNPANTTVSSVDATGAFTTTGAGVTPVTFGLCPIVIGVAASGDPKTAVVIGDSLVEGTGALNVTGTFNLKSLGNLGIPCLAICKGGMSQYTLFTATIDWKSYLPYARILIDSMGTNDGNRVLTHFDYWLAAKQTYNYTFVGHVGLFPASSSTDSWATEVNQTTSNTFPRGSEFVSSSSYLDRYIDLQYYPMSIRGVAGNKWKGNAPALTTDGTHQSQTGDDLLVTEMQSVYQQAFASF